MEIIGIGIKDGWEDGYKWRWDVFDDGLFRGKVVFKITGYQFFNLMPKKQLKAKKTIGCKGNNLLPESEISLRY